MEVAEKVRVKGLGQYQKHGVYSVRDQVEAALEKADRSLLMELEEELSSHEGIDAQLRRRAVMGVIMCTKIEQHIEAEMESGASLQDIPILKAWPAFQNAAGRALRAAKDTLPKNGGSQYGAELEHIRKVTRDEAEADANED